VIISTRPTPYAASPPASRSTSAATPSTAPSAGSWSASRRPVMPAGAWTSLGGRKPSYARRA